MARAALVPVYTEVPTMGLDGRGVLSGARAPLPTDGRIGDFWIDTVTKKLYGAKTAAGWPDRGLIRGAAGWTARERIVADGSRQVVEIYDWTGGEGVKPATGYKTAAGAVSADIAEGADVRGGAGPQALINALAAGSDDLTLDSLTATAESTGDNEKQPLKNVLGAAGALPFDTVAAASALEIPKSVKTVWINGATAAEGGPGHLRRRVNVEPASGPKHRSADRFTADGGTDSANGGWWAVVKDYTAAVVGAVARTKQSKLDETWSLIDAGGVPNDPSFDNTAALNLFFARAAGRGCGFIPAGAYYFKSALDVALASTTTIYGDRFRSALIYNGASTTANLLNFGAAETHTNKTALLDFVIGAVTDMTAGNALTVTNCSELDLNLVIDGSGTYKIFDGIYLDGCSIIDMHGSVLATERKKIAWRNGVELHLNHAKMFGKQVPGQSGGVEPAGGHGTGIGVHIGGGCGGFYAEDVTQLLCAVGVQIDTTLSANGNTQFFLDTGTWDTNRDAAVVIDDAVLNPIGKYIGLNGWFASTTRGPGIKLLNWTGGQIICVKGVIVNCFESGIFHDDPTANLVLGNGAHLAVNYQYGVAADQQVTIRSGCTPLGNYLGTYNDNVVIANDLFGVQRLHPKADQWVFDGTEITHTIANGANVTLPAGSGEVTIAILETGDNMKVLIGGSGVKACTDDGQSTGGAFVIGATPAPGKWSVGWNGSGYGIFNNTGGSKTFIVVPFLRTRVSI